MKLNWNFQRGGGSWEKNPFCGGGMDVFWNYTMFVVLMRHFSQRFVQNSGGWDQEDLRD